MKETLRVTYEFSFASASGAHSRQAIAAPFVPFKPCRGRPKVDVLSLGLVAAKGMGFMIRSFFGQPQQEGHLGLSLSPFLLPRELMVMAVILGWGRGRGGAMVLCGGPLADRVLQDTSTAYLLLLMSWRVVVRWIYTSELWF